jgi:hypothetical protein
MAETHVNKGLEGKIRPQKHYLSCPIKNTPNNVVKKIKKVGNRKKL